jgi:predicted nucleic acid-binding protein
MSDLVVIDSSFALAWCFLDEQNDQSEELLDRMSTDVAAIVPAVWFWEVNNALVRGVRHKRKTEEHRSDRVAFLKSLPIRVDSSSLDNCWSVTSTLAAVERLTVYDSSYLEIALRLGVAIGTFDQALRTVAERRGIKVLGRKDG